MRFSVFFFRKVYSLAFGRNSYLRGHGWFASVIRKRPVDSHGMPLPWLSYPFIDFIDPRLDPCMKVLEFGTGYSTLYWSERTGQVFGIEHDPAWKAELEASLPANADVRLVEFDPRNPDAYAKAADNWGMRFDIIVVDGPERNATLLHAVELLSDSGVIVLDNASRERYRASADLLQSRLGFRRIDFKGMCPGAARESCTTLFYRTGNCLGI